MRSGISERARERVLLTGVGPVCPWGLGVGAFAASLWQELDQARQMAVGEARTRSQRIRRVPDFELGDYVESKRPYLDPHSRFALAAASLALASASSKPEIAEPRRSGLSMGTFFGDMASLELFQRSVRQKGMRLASPMLFPHCYANTTNSLLCIEFSLRGHNQNFCCDSLCGATSVAAAHGAVRRGAADLMLAGGCDAFSEKILGLLQSECGSAGTPPLSEGACFLVLESEGSAQRRKSTPVCEVASVVSGARRVPGRPEAKEAAERILEAVRSVIARTLQEARLWEGDLGVVLFAQAPGDSELIADGGRQALSAISQLPRFDTSAVGGWAFAATFPFLCAAAALILKQGMVPSPPKLERVRHGVEVWMEQQPVSLLGDAALVLAWSPHGVVAATLKTI